MQDSLNAYVKKWNLANPGFLVETFTSRVYTVTYKNQPAILKLLNDVGIRDEANGAVALACFDGRGAVKLLAHDGAAHLLEFADGHDVASLAKQGQDNQATAIIADALNTLHTCRCDAASRAKLTSLEDRFECLFKYAAHKQSEDIYKRAAKVAKKLLSSQVDQRVLHGDMHHENLIYSKSRGWLAIDPKGLYGERTFDAVNTLLNPTHELAVNEKRYLQTAQILAEHMKLDISRLLAYGFAYACLGAAWSIEDKQDPAKALAVAKIAERHVTLT